MSSPDQNPPPDQSGSNADNSSNGQAPPLFSMNFFVPLNPSAPGQPPAEGAPQASVSWTMSFSTQPPPGHPASTTPTTNGIPPVGINFGPGTPIPAVGIPPMFPPFNFPAFFAPPPEPQPDPDKAKELLRSLPDVSDGLMGRINRLCDADEPDAEVKGWQCGVCMEGVNEGRMEEGTGVKGLPCNHLFHAGCLEPWFLTKQTCPACRLDLDPLRTMGRSSTAASSGRASRPPRTGFNPMRRDAMPPHRQTDPSSATTSTNNASASNNAGGDADDLVDVEIPFSFTFRVPTPPPVDALLQSAASTTSPAPHDARSPPLIRPAPMAVHLNSPTPPSLTPDGMLGQRIHQSPSPNAPTRQTTPPSVAPASVTLPLPAPHQFPPANPQIGLNGPLPFSAIPLGPTPPFIPQFPMGAPSATGQPRLHAPQPRRPHVVVHHNHPPPPPGQGPPPFVPANFHPPMVPPQIIHIFHGGPPPERPPAPAPNAKKKFVAKPLEDWVKERERERGWRHDCDAPSCDQAPPTDAPQNAAAKSTPAPLEPLFGGGVDDIAKPACTHRYHAGCLETMERSAGRWNVQEDGKVYVRCARCRKDGWVLARDTEEEEVERGLNEA